MTFRAIKPGTISLNVVGELNMSSLRAKALWPIALGVLFAVCEGRAASQTVVDHTVVKWNKFSFHSVQIDLRSEAVLPAVVHSPRLETFWELVREDTPVVAVTGTFFNTSSGYPVGDIVVNGRRTAEGLRGSVLAVNWFGEVDIFDSGYQKGIDWGNYRFGLRGTVRLLRDGKLAVNPKAQHFKDGRVWSRAARCAVGTKKNGDLVIFATQQGVTLVELGKAMLQAGVTNAVNLDGGASACLFYRGDLKVKPGRKLSNLFVVYERSPFLLPTR